MRAFDKFILRVLNRRGQRSERDREKDERRYPSTAPESSSNTDPHGRD